MAEPCLIYVTAASAEQAKTIGRALVEAKLVACVNILGGVTSIYRWQGAVVEDGEVVLLAKTRSARVDAVIDTVKSHHGYECPCIVVLPIIGGNPPFLDWIGQETAEA